MFSRNFTALTAGAVVRAVDLATARDIHMADGFMKTEVSWVSVISAEVTGLIAFLPALQSISMLRAAIEPTGTA